MSDAPRLRSLSGIIYEQTEAQWAVDNRIFGSNVQLVPIDGANQGKHKLGNGINTYAELGFVEDGGGGLSVHTYTGITDASGQVTVDTTVLFPGGGALPVGVIAELGESAYWGVILSNTSGVMLFQFADESGGAAAAGCNVYITVSGQQ